MLAILSIDAVLPYVTKPGRYTNHELNAVHKDWVKAAMKFVLAFPDIYDIGMGNLGLKILYHIVNERQDALAERVFAPWPDMATKLQEQNLPLFALESRRPLGAFDAVGFTLQHELSYTTVIWMLDLAYIPRRASDRRPQDPLIIGGGPSVCNPEPMAEFFDVFVLGEGEEALVDLVDVFVAAKETDDRRSALLQRLATMPGFYVPSHYSPAWSENGMLTGMEYSGPNESTVQKRLVQDLDAVPYPSQFVVPYVETVHDRAMVELFRGCTRGCRFCQAGMIYRPVRERSPAVIEQQIQRLCESSGYEEVSLTSLSSGDYSCISNLVTNLQHDYGDNNTTISLPSLRADRLSVQLAAKIQQGRKTGLTFAPEAGTQRLRDVINKNVTEQDILDTAAAAFENGWQTIKLYFMIGLPTETEEDVAGIGDLAYKILQLGREIRRGKKVRQKAVSVTVSVSTFIPKSHTPFQWEAQGSPEEIRKKQALLRQHLRQKAIKLQFSDTEQSLVEGALARGDRRLSDVILAAVDSGAKLDSWSEHFSFAAWSQAFAAAQVDPAWYCYRQRCKEEHFPWDHLDYGLQRDFLWRERELAYGEKLTGDCRDGQCSQCGVCSREIRSRLAGEAK